jgi:hypothetical protein
MLLVEEHYKQQFVQLLGDQWQLFVVDVMVEVVVDNYYLMLLLFQNIMLLLIVV